MPEQPCAVDPARRSAAELNALIRAHSAGRRDWPRAELIELAELQSAWRKASARETALAA